MDSGWKTKTKIEMAVFIILIGFRSRLVFVNFFDKNHFIRPEIFLSLKYDFLGVKNP